MLTSLLSKFSTRNLIAGFIVPLGALAGSSANGAVSTSAWDTFYDHPQASASVTQRSLRGLALSNDGSVIFGGYIQGTGSGTTAVVAYDSSTAGILATLPMSGAQPSGIDTDDRGNVYAISGASGSAKFQVVNYNQGTNTFGTPVSTTLAGSTQDSGISVLHTGSNYYAYITLGATIRRYDVTGVPALDTTFGTGGTFTVPLAVSLRGLEVESDGTIYVADRQSTAGDGSTTGLVFEIPSTLTGITAGAAYSAFDVTEAQGKLYVTNYSQSGSYGASSSRLTVLNTNLSADSVVVPSTINPLLSHTALADTGYSGIAISSSGQVFIADQIYGGGTTNSQDRIIASEVPEPAALSLLMIAGAFVGRRRRK